MGQNPTPVVAQALEHTITLCRSLGHELQPVAAPRIDGQVISDSFFAIAGFGLTQLARMMTPLLGRAPGPQELEPFTLELIDWFATLPEEVVPNAITALDAAGQSMRNFLAAYDVVLCPTMPIRLPLWRPWHQPSVVSGWSKRPNSLRVTLRSTALPECPRCPCHSTYQMKTLPSAAILARRSGRRGFCSGSPISSSVPVAGRIAGLLP